MDKEIIRADREITKTEANRADREITRTEANITKTNMFNSIR